MPEDEFEHMYLNSLRAPFASEKSLVGTIVTECPFQDCVWVCCALAHLVQ